MGAGFLETCVVPFESWRSNPLRFSSAARVLHYDPHTVTAIIVREITENPDAWMSHVYDGGNALRSADPQHWNRRWIRNGIAVERDNLEGVTWQRQTTN